MGFEKEGIHVFISCIIGQEGFETKVEPCGLTRLGCFWLLHLLNDTETNPESMASIPLNRDRLDHPIQGAMLDILVVSAANFYYTHATLKAFALRNRGFFVGQQVPARLLEGERSIASDFFDLGGRLALP